MFKEVGKMLGELQIENSKLKQTLTEIKEIAETFDEDDEVRILLLQKCEVLDE